MYLFIDCPGIYKCCSSHEGSLSCQTGQRQCAAAAAYEALVRRAKLKAAPRARTTAPSPVRAGAAVALLAAVIAAAAVLRRGSKRRAYSRAGMGDLDELV